MNRHMRHSQSNRGVVDAEIRRARNLVVDELQDAAVSEVDARGGVWRNYQRRHAKLCRRAAPRLIRVNAEPAFSSILAPEQSTGVHPGENALGARRIEAEAERAIAAHRHG